MRLPGAKYGNMYIYMNQLDNKHDPQTLHQNCFLLASLEIKLSMGKKSIANIICGTI